MKFKNLKIAGFKSFAEPCEISLDRGLAGVVGPNGCGKSNIIDAIKWAMGEFSHKSLRGQSMDDVIFSGSRNRPARNFADVTLTLERENTSNIGKVLGHDTLEITRKITRGIGSQYKINNKEARAKDVQLLFADMSLGAHSASIVQQGQISSVILAKPEKRRYILEEAAGIAGLYQRRHDVELKLKATSSNLLRLDDITTEMSNQLNNLKRQTRHAKRYKKLSAEIRKLEMLIYHISLEETNIEINKCNNNKNELKAEIAKLQSFIKHDVLKIEKSEQELKNLKENEAVRSAVIQRIRVELSKLEAHDSHLKDRKKQLENQLSGLAADSKREEDFASEVRETLQKLDIDKQNHADNKYKLEAKIKELESDKKLKSTELSQIELAHNKAYENYIDKKHQIEKSQKIKEELLGQIERNQREVLDKDQEAQKLSKNQDKLLLKGKSELEEKLQVKLTSLQEQLSEILQNKNIIEEELEAARNAKLQSESEIHKVQSELTSLDNLIKSLLKSEDNPVINHISVYPGYEKALSACFGNSLEMPLYKDKALSDRSYWANIIHDYGQIDFPEGATPLNQFIEVPDELKYRLDMTALVDEDIALSIQPQLKEGQNLVSKQGGLWRWDGYVNNANVASKTAEHIENLNRISLLEAKMENLEATHRKNENEFNNLNQKRANLLSQEKALKEEEINLTNNLRIIQTDIRELNNKISHEIERYQKLVALISKLNDDQTTLKARLEECLKSELAVDNITKLEADLEKLAKKLTAKRQENSLIISNFAKAEEELKNHSSQLSNYESDKNSWQQRLKNSSNHLEELKIRATSLRDEINNHEYNPSEIIKAKEKLDAELKTAQNQHFEINENLSQAENQQKNLLANKNNNEHKLYELKEELARFEVKLEALDDKKQEASKLLESKFNNPSQLINKDVDTKQLIEEYIEKGFDAQKLRFEIEKLQSERERLGSVNLRAEEESNELIERFDEINEERQDLEKAISKIKKAINDLNSEGRERLLAAFDDVNKHFRDLFKRLFKGGDASLKLIENDDDPLGAGLEIYARPPGKRLTTLSLLSGGEQTLTALALIFAIFMTNPSPICVLDEVDAPLDDQNVHLFCDLIKDINRETNTSFVIITHHSYTMSQMNCLYGVTMYEKGVSQLVSVNLDEANAISDIKVSA